MTAAASSTVVAWTLALAAGAAAWGIARAARRLGLTARLLGDERDYAAHLTPPCGARKSLTFARLPGYAWVLRKCRTIRTACAAQSAMVVASVGIATAIALSRVAPSGASWWAAVGASAIAAFNVERLVLATRLWPDVSMGLASALLLAFAIAPIHTAAGTALGFVGGVALCTFRPDAIVAVAATAAVAQRPVETRVALVVACVAIGAAIRWRLAHQRRSETTTWFNLMVAECVARGRHVRQSVAMMSALHEWWDLDADERRDRGRRSARWLASHPLQWGRMVVRNAGALAGPDSFVRSRLLDGRTPRVLVWALVGGTPLLVISACAGATSADDTRSAAAVLVPLAAQWLACSLLVTRTRFRAALLPWLTLPAVSGAAQLAAGDGRALAGAAIGAIVVALARPHELEPTRI